MACGDDAEYGIYIRVRNNPPVSLSKPWEQVWVPPLCFQTNVKENKRHLASDSAVGFNSTFSLKYVWMMVFLMLYNNSIRMLSAFWINPASFSLFVSMQFARLHAAKQSTLLHQTQCKVEEWTLNGPPCCTNPSLWQQSDLFEVRGKKRSVVSKGRKSGSEAKTEGWAGGWE